MSYRYRQELARQRAQERSGVKTQRRAIEADAIISEFEEAYNACNGAKTRVAYKHGWAVINGKRHSLGTLVEQTKRLWAAVHERGITA